MSNSTVFTNGTAIQAPWMNDVNTAVYVSIPAIEATIGTVINESSVVATSGQTVFTIPFPWNGANLSVYINGVKQIVTSNYTVSGNTVTFTSGVPYSAVVDFVG